jgi:hypothetical protein
MVLRMLIANDRGRRAEPWEVVAVGRETFRVVAMESGDVWTVDALSMRGSRMGRTYVAEVLLDEWRKGFAWCEGGRKMMEEWLARRKLAAM